MRRVLFFSVVVVLFIAPDVFAQGVKPGGRAVVVDSTGKVVGPVVAGLGVTGINRLQNASAFVSIRVGGETGVAGVYLGAEMLNDGSTRFLFTSDDCSGTPYLLSNVSTWAGPTLFIEQIENWPNGGGELYKVSSDATVESLEVHSERYGEGQCYDAPYAQPVFVVPAEIAVADISPIFTPPYSLGFSSGVFCDGLECGSTACWSETEGR